MKAKVIKTGEIIYDAVEYETEDSFEVKGRTKDGRFIRRHADEVLILPMEIQIKKSFEESNGHLIDVTPTFDWEKLEIETAARIYAQNINSCFPHEDLELRENSCNAAHMFVEYAKERYNQNNEQE